MSAKVQVSHHIRALPPALKAMQAMGYSAGECLAGTGIEPGDLLEARPTPVFSLAQEFRFHRNLLRLSGDPLLGLKLGQAYSLQTYGLFGYAFMSAPTLRQALNIASNYGPLSFTLFRVAFRESASAGILQFSRLVDIPDDLFTYYVDRDVSAALAGADPDHIAPIKPIGIALMHGGEGRRQDYERFFGCPVDFDAPRSEVRVDAAVLDTAMPLRDADTSAICQQQCQLLLARMSRSSGFVEQVRQLIVARPGHFPDIDYVAQKLCMTSRTLRRRLTAEGSSYQQILADVRYQLAREYLATSRLAVEEIAALLGYSNPGNFTHAFKRWHGSPPRQYRQEHR
ncbi:MAG: AraC family transcriptional regulator [Halieaceae bacterium]|nr:AraC family transcriptional regulator [Halieaceae bacterium]MCP5165915.1 AraC family transcriptional regulator [Pseudomonadales bacterium]MCP5187402.1 AraC family transcriptional regulator [Pseudomonadales bacterium]